MQKEPSLALEQPAFVQLPWGSIRTPSVFSEGVSPRPHHLALSPTSKRFHHLLTPWGPSLHPAHEPSEDKLCAKHGTFRTGVSSLTQKLPKNTSCIAIYVFTAVSFSSTHTSLTAQVNTALRELRCVPKPHSSRVDLSACWCAFRCGPREE